MHHSDITVMLSKVPEWVEGYAGFKPDRSTVFRWKTRGCRGKKLKTFRVGGRVCTKVEWLLEFFEDGESDLAPAIPGGHSDSEADAYLASEGF